MNNVFVRIYGGTIAACLLIGLVFYLAVEATNYFRLQHFRNHLATGPINLIVDSVAARPPEQREKWVSLLSRWFGSHILLVEADALELNRTDLERLQRGQMLLRYRAGDRRGVAIMKIPGSEEQYLYAEGERITEQQAKGLTLVVMEYLNRHPVEEWNRLFVDLNKQFGFPVERILPHQINLNETQVVRLFKDKEVIVQFKEQAGGGTSITSYGLLPQTGEVMVMGPQSMFNWYPIELLAVMVVAAMALVGLAAYFLVKPLEHRLSRLEKAVLRIRGGDLSARAPVDGNDAIGQLAGTINGMAEHIQRLISSQKELTRAVSHELRTPVARIRFGLEMLADEDDEQRRTKKFDDIDQDIEQLDKLIDEILTYSKLEEGTPVLDFVTIDVHALLEKIERESLALGTGIDIVYERADMPEHDRFAEGEERYIHRVVQNYVGNALRYATGKVLISYSVIGDIFRIDVEDDGPGIPEEDRKRVFQPFTRLDDSRTRASGGYGLGLSIVARIAFWHGGKVKVSESRYGGAMFTFMWPRMQSMRETS